MGLFDFLRKKEEKKEKVDIQELIKEFEEKWKGLADSITLQDKDKFLNDFEEDYKKLEEKIMTEENDGLRNNAQREVRITKNVLLGKFRGKIIGLERVAEYSKRTSNKTISKGDINNFTRTWEKRLQEAPLEEREALLTQYEKEAQDLMEKADEEGKKSIEDFFRLAEAMRSEAIARTNETNEKINSRIQDLETRLNALDKSPGSVKSKTVASDMAKEFSREFEGKEKKKEFDNKYGKYYKKIHDIVSLSMLGLTANNHKELIEKINENLDFVNEEYKTNIDIDMLIVPFLLKKKEMNILNNQEELWLTTICNKYQIDNCNTYDEAWNTFLPALYTLGKIIDMDIDGKILNDLVISIKTFLHDMYQSVNNSRGPRR